MKHLTKSFLEGLQIETICTVEEAEERLSDNEPDEDLLVVENFGDQRVLVSEPGIFIPSLKIIAMSAIVVNNDDGMADWAGTALLRISEKGFHYSGIEQDSMITTLYNAFGVNASENQAFVIEGITNKIILTNEMIKQNDHLENSYANENCNEGVLCNEY